MTFIARVQRIPINTMSSRQLRLEETYDRFTASYNRGENPTLVDQVNYNESIFSDPFPTGDWASIFNLRPCYGSTMGDFEAAIPVIEKEASLGDPQNRENRFNWIHGNYCVAICAGASSAISTTVDALIERDNNRDKSEILFTTPCYPIASSIARTRGLRAVPCNAQKSNGDLDLNKVAEKINKRTLCTLLTSPGNPICNGIPKDGIQSFLELLKISSIYDSFVVHDAVFENMSDSDLLWEDIMSDAVLASKYIKIWSPSKIVPFASGQRVGYAIFNKLLRNHFVHARISNGNSIATASLLYLVLALQMIAKRRDRDQNIHRDKFWPITFPGVYENRNRLDFDQLDRLIEGAVMTQIKTETRLIQLNQALKVNVEHSNWLQLASHKPHASTFLVIVKALEQRHEERLIDRLESELGLFIAPRKAFDSFGIQSGFRFITTAWNEQEQAIIIAKIDKLVSSFL